ncbi:MAG: phosphoglycerate dehydrogenase [Firmicutes bacterium]|jgi:D-3-phosphoglycerate dehydrogenase|nr:phosphoglycerate dehydrogenase [Dethiobacter sp.]MBS3897624.1 phosphoglycerate dehydrogenase [Dethiobacter sp.]MCL4463289.1 phosphoglycerate dehydrogenase [Bacillota bacterium]MCL5993037.1 phosphoglycerate dehydrogenase [Bacillota bacterium]
MKVLVSDQISDLGVAKLREKALVDVKTDMTPEQLVAVISQYDALVVRSSTKVTRQVLEAGTNLKVVGRAGVGVDNIDVEAATERGIIVINAPEGNTISAAEHTIAMMTSLARNIPDASTSMKKGEWKRSKFMGVELYKKTLGVVGIGRIGSEVIKRAKAMDMDILAYDPYIAAERAEKMGVTLTSLEEIYRKADFITVHTPLTKATKHMIGKKELAMMKDGVRIINCARGGLIDENALYDALVSGKVAGAALDVFEEEPVSCNPLCSLSSVIATPHLGASTEEAQVNVAVQVAEQVANALLGEPLVSAVNVPVIPPETLADVKPFIPLLKKLGSFYTQVFNGQVEAVEILYSGEIANYPVTPLTNSFLIGLLSVILQETVNYVNAPVIAKQRGIKVREVVSKTVENFTNLITVTIKTADGTQTIAGTLFNRDDIRIVQIGKYRIEVIPSRYMLVTTYMDMPGVIGRFGITLGNHNINIAGMQVGRQSIGGEAVMVLQVDSPVSEEIIAKLQELDAIMSIRFVRLD